ncbi:selenide, water dikinase SelD, partial [Streptomyces sp. NPDC003233]
MGDPFSRYVQLLLTITRAKDLVVVDDGTATMDFLGHLHKLARASGVTAVIDTAAVPYLAGAREGVRDGYVSGGTRRNLEWVAPHTEFGDADADTRLLLADAQTSGGLLVAGEVPGAPVVGELVPRGSHSIVLR